MLASVGAPTTTNFVASARTHSSRSIRRYNHKRNVHKYNLNKIHNWRNKRTHANDVRNNAIKREHAQHAKDARGHKSHVKAYDQKRYNHLKQVRALDVRKWEQSHKKSSHTSSKLPVLNANQIESQAKKLGVKKQTFDGDDSSGANIYYILGIYDGYYTNDPIYSANLDSEYVNNDNVAVISVPGFNNHPDNKWYGKRTWDMSKFYDNGVAYGQTLRVHYLGKNSSVKFNE